MKVGDKVKIDPAHAGRWYGIVFTVEALLPKNANLSSPHAPRGLRAPKSCLIPADAETPAAVVTTIPFEPALAQGTLVRFQDAYFVVITQNRNGRYRIVKLGGDKGKYFTNVVRSHMTVVDPVEVMI